MSFNRLLVVAIAGGLLLAGPVAAQEKAKSMESGFLGSGYSKLKEVELSFGAQGQALDLPGNEGWHL